MKLILKEFQEDTVSKLVHQLRLAARESAAGDTQSVSLSSPTGSGKTVIVTRCIEVLLQGDDEHPPVEDATFLWITDQPELNEQTRRKMLTTSSFLTTDRLVVIDSSFDEETLTPGVVHFINTQKLGKAKELVTLSDKRAFTFWDTVKNTADARPGRFYVIIDEAHRGMREGKGGQEASTIIQKFIKGSQGELSPVPIIVGISATPERFNQLIAGSPRTSRSVPVDVQDVRASGLIKETIVLHHPKKTQPTDMTMLREAAKALKKFTAEWSKYCAEEDVPHIAPLLVVQVEDARNKKELSGTDLGEALRVLREELGNVSSNAFAHSFQEGTAQEVDGQTLRYLAPSNIEADPDVQVVFFKTSLNTGWDCPRAEVMMSFRVAADATYIAQLVGRMVRTPLARRIARNEALNTVSLYLPHYDTKGVERIVERLSSPDEGMPAIDVEDAETRLELGRQDDMEKAFAAIEALPSYIVPRQHKSSQIRRLMKLARLLTHHGVDDDAMEKAKKHLLGVLDAEHKRLSSTDRFREIVDERAKIEIDAVNWDVGADAVREGQSVTVDIASENIHDLFEATGRKLSEGLHKMWWRKRAKDLPPEKREEVKLELFALCTDADVLKALETAGQKLVGKWLDEYRHEIAELDDESRNSYEEIKNLAASPELMPIRLPDTITVRDHEQSWPEHLYVDEKGMFPEKLNKAEERILNEKLSEKGVIGWLRIIPRKPWALCVPYLKQGEDRAMYPDFLILRKVKSKIVVDLIDPHLIEISDAAEKAAGMARFAAKHADAFGRIELILLQGANEKRLDLHEEVTRQRVQGVTAVNELRMMMGEA